MCSIAPALKRANCWKLWRYFLQSAVNHKFLNIYGLFRDYTPSSVCYKNSYFNKPYSFLYTKNHTHIRHFSVSPCNYKINNNISEINNDKFSYYLTGLIEGDATIFVAKTEITKHKLNYPSIQITFHFKDLPLALLLQKELGDGSLARKKGINAYVLSINNYDGLLLLISLINGKMRTPKIHSLYSLIDWYNLKGSGFNFEKKELDKSSL